MEDRSLKKIKKPLPDSVYLLLLVFQWSCYSKSFNLPLLKQIQGSSILSLSASKCLQNHDFSKETTISPSSEWTQKDSTLRSHWFYNNICRFKTAWSITHHMDDLEEVSNLLTAGISLSLSLSFSVSSFLPPLSLLIYFFSSMNLKTLMVAVGLKYLLPWTLWLKHNCATRILTSLPCTDAETWFFFRLCLSSPCK